MYSGKADRLADAATAILAGKEVVVPGLMDGKPDELLKRRTKVLRLRASLKLLDYNLKRDFVDWGSDEFRPLGVRRVRLEQPLDHRVPRIDLEVHAQRRVAAFAVQRLHHATHVRRHHLVRVQREHG